MSTVATYSYTHSVTYVTDNILKSLKDIILLSGLDPEHFADRWESNTRAIKTWLGTGDLRKVILEIYNPATDYRVVSVDAVPAFDTGDQYEIPDTASGKWIKTDPEIHKDKATAAHQAYGNEWKGLVRMVKYWNNNPKHGDLKPVKPSFLIEVMALECLYGGWGGSFDREIQSFFATLADRVHDEWPDPAGLGPAISNDMDAARKQRAQQLLFQASQDASIAIDHARRGRNIEALRAWRALFGPKFPLS